MLRTDFVVEELAVLRVLEHGVLPLLLLIPLVLVPLLLVLKRSRHQLLQLQHQLLRLKLQQVLVHLLKLLLLQLQLLRLRPQRHLLLMPGKHRLRPCLQSCQLRINGINGSCRHTAVKRWY